MAMSKMRTLQIRVRETLAELEQVKRERDAAVAERDEARANAVTKALELDKALHQLAAFRAAIEKHREERGGKAARQERNLELWSVLDASPAPEKAEASS